MTNAEAIQLLELTPPFTKEELKKAYRQAQMVWHPDRFTGNDELHAKALARSYLINEAFSDISRALEAGYVFEKTAQRQGVKMYHKAAKPEPPKSAEDFYRRGIGYHSEGSDKKAIADFAEAIRIDPTKPSYYHSRGIVFQECGKIEKAIADLSEAIRLDPSIRCEPDLAAAYNVRGIANIKRARLDKAIADYCEAIRLNPNKAIYYCNRGCAYHNKLLGFALGFTANREKALADYCEAIKRDLKNPNFYFLGTS